jgi:hypothetical protein
MTYNYYNDTLDAASTAEESGGGNVSLHDGGAGAGEDLYVVEDKEEVRCVYTRSSSNTFPQIYIALQSMFAQYYHRLLRPPPPAFFCV